MPRLSRFLFGDWLTPSHINFSASDNSASSGYIDGKNASHTRIVSEIENGWKILDEIGGKFKKAVVRWILKPGDWEIENYSIRNGSTLIKVGSENIHSFNLLQRNESLFYMEKSTTLVLEVQYLRPCTIRTDITFS